MALTAQDLRSGSVVYWRGANWTPYLAEALIARNADEVECLRTLAADANAGDTVIEAFVFPLAEAPGAVRPLDLRETWRAEGPSIAFGPDRAAGNAA